MPQNQVLNLTLAHLRNQNLVAFLKPCKESCADSDTDVCSGLYLEGVVYGDGRDWIECAEDCELDANGKERVCPSCLC